MNGEYKPKHERPSIVRPDVTSFREFLRSEGKRDYTSQVFDIFESVSTIFSYGQTSLGDLNLEIHTQPDHSLVLNNLYDFRNFNMSRGTCMELAAKVFYLTQLKYPHLRPLIVREYDGNHNNQLCVLNHPNEPILFDGEQVPYSRFDRMYALSTMEIQPGRLVLGPNAVAINFFGKSPKLENARAKPIYSIEEGIMAGMKYNHGTTINNYERLAPQTKPRSNTGIHIWVKKDGGYVILSNMNIDYALKGKLGCFVQNGTTGEYRLFPVLDDQLRTNLLGEDRQLHETLWKLSNKISDTFG